MFSFLNVHVVYLILMLVVFVATLLFHEQIKAFIGDVAIDARVKLAQYKADAELEATRLKTAYETQLATFKASYTADIETARSHINAVEADLAAALMKVELLTGLIKAPAITVNPVLNVVSPSPVAPVIPIPTLLVPATVPPATAVIPIPTPLVPEAAPVTA